MPCAQTKNVLNVLANPIDHVLTMPWTRSRRGGVNLVSHADYCGSSGGVYILGYVPTSPVAPHMLPASCPCWSGSQPMP